MGGTIVSEPAPLAAHVADRLGQLTTPWDVFAERSRRFELHLTGTRTTLKRGPIVVEGFGVRVLSEVDQQVGIGYQSSTLLTEDGIRAAAEDAKKLSRFNRFPAKHPELPGARPSPGGGPRVLDSSLWSDPEGTLERYAAALVEGTNGRNGTALSFASVRVTLTETSIANSTGLVVAYPHTVAETEGSVTASGGPEGRPPGEYWFAELGRRLDDRTLRALTGEWSRYAEDARRARPPPNGNRPVALPPEVLEGILPPVLRFRFGGVAKLRGLGVEPGAHVGGDALDVLDDGTIDWAWGSAPVDDEGAPRAVHKLVANGRANATLADSLYADALGLTPTGSAGRSGGTGVGALVWRKFTRAPAPDASTILLPAGTGGDDAELIEHVEDGVWVQQIGWAQPDPVSGRFGGEIRMGYRIRHGKLAEPVRGGTVGGVVLAAEGAPSLLRDLLAAGSTPKLVGGVSTPTLLIRSLSVSGDDPARSPVDA